MNPQSTAADRAVEMIDTKGKRHLVAKITDLSGQDNWCSRKFIATRGHILRLLAPGRHHRVDPGEHVMTHIVHTVGIAPCTLLVHTRDMKQTENPKAARTNIIKRVVITTKVGTAVRTKDTGHGLMTTVQVVGQDNLSKAIALLSEAGFPILTTKDLGCDTFQINV